MERCRILVPSGVLGAGCPPEALERGLSLKPHAIALDAGSTDSGPYYLGAGVSKMTRKAIKRDLRELMLARDRLKIPLLIGSCGTSGTDSGVDWTADICREIAREEGLSFRLARLYSEQDRTSLKLKLKDNKIAPLAPMGELDPAEIDACSHIVALLGHPPFVEALNRGADIVLGGRTTDTAVLAAVPLMNGLPAAFSWHAAKIAECGGVCTQYPRRGGVMIDIGPDDFLVDALHPDNACTVRSVSAHMLYENADPYRLKEPGVLLDASDARYEQIDERRVRVTGSQIEAMPYTMKLEGSGPAGFRTMIFVAIADPKVLANLNEWLSRLEAHLRKGIDATLGYARTDYELELRAYGWNALQIKRRDSSPPSGEVGIMMLVQAQTQAAATEIAKFCNPSLLHYPLNADDPMPSFAFPYSPAEVEMGPAYAFRLNHVVHLDHPLELVRMGLEDVAQGVADAVA